MRKRNDDGRGRRNRSLALRVAPLDALESRSLATEPISLMSLAMALPFAAAWAGATPQSSRAAAAGPQGRPARRLAPRGDAADRPQAFAAPRPTRGPGFQAPLRDAQAARPAQARATPFETFAFVAGGRDWSAATPAMRTAAPAAAGGGAIGGGAAGGSSAAPSRVGISADASRGASADQAPPSATPAASAPESTPSASAGAAPAARGTGPAAASSFGGSSLSITSGPAVTVQNGSTSSIPEGKVLKALITISPAPTSSFDLQMSVAAASGVGASAADYQIVTSSPIKIGVGQTSAEFFVKAVDDGIADPGELFKVSAVDPMDGTYTVVSGSGFTFGISDGVTTATATTPSGNQGDAKSHPDDSCPCTASTDPWGALRYNPYLNGQPMCGAPFGSYMQLANPHPLVSADWQLPPTLPAKVKAELTFNGTLVSTTYFSTAGFAAGDRAHASIQYDAGSLATGRYGYTITLRSLNASGVEFGTAQTVSGSTEVYNWTASPYGRGWWMQDLDRIVAGSGGVLLVRGDATAGWFASAGVGTYTTPAGSNTTLTGSSTTGWTLARTDGGRQVFDAAGQLQADVDVDGGPSTYTYDGSNRLSGFQDPFGRLATYTYNGTLLETRSDLYGRVTSYAYDANDRLTTITQADPDGPGGPEVSPVTKLAYDADGLLRTAVDPLGNATTFTYTSRRLTGVELPGRGAAEQYSPVALRGLPGAGQGTSGNPAPLARAADADKATVTDATGRTTTIAYDLLGNPTEATDPLGNTTYYGYDARGNLTDVVTPDPDGAGPLGAAVTAFSYDSIDNLASVRLPDGRTRSFTYESGTRWLKSFTDEAGETTSYTLNTKGHPTAVVDPLGRTTSYGYATVAGVTGFLESVTAPDPDGVGPLTSSTTSYAYDSKGRVGTMTHPGGATIKYTYDGADNLRTVVDELERTTTYAYDALGRRTVTTGPDPDGGGPLTSPTATVAYDRRGLVTKVTDPLSRDVNYEYDAGGRLLTVTRPDPDGTGPLGTRITTYAYDAADRPTTVRDPLNRVVSYGYDAGGRLRTVTQPDPDGVGPLSPPVATYSYDNLNRTTAVAAPLGRTTSYVYDSRDRVTQIVEADPDGAVPINSPITTIGYDAVGRRTSVVDPLGRATTFAYDDAGQLTSVTGPDPDGIGVGQASPVTAYVYDSRGRTIAVVDPLLHRTTYGYDSRDRLTTITDPRGGQTVQAYDLAGNLTSITDPGGNRTTYLYDNLDRATTIVDPRSKSTINSFDAVGNLTMTLDRLGRSVQYAYDADDQVKTERWIPVGGGAAVNAVTYTYDAVGRMIQVQDAASRNAFVYDALDRLSTVDNQGTTGLPQVTLTYRRDDLGNRTGLADSKGGTTSYAYDALDRLTRITQSGTGVAAKRVDVDYDAAGQRTALTRYSDLAGATKVVATTYAYDGLGRTTGISHKTGAGAPRVSFGYVYDADGRVTQENRGWNLGVSSDKLDTIDYTYTTDDQLTSVSHSNGSYAAENFSYDANGNRDAASGYTTAVGNRTTGDGVYTYAYDDEGNQVSRTKAGEQTLYKWDHRNRLIEVDTIVDGYARLAAAYTYDALDRRIGEASYPEGTSPTAGNAGFEAAGTWSFGANTGVTANGSVFTNQNPPAPQGGQVAYILGNGAGATLSQTISGWQPGTYTLTFLAAQRVNYPAGGRQTLQVVLDDVTVLATVTPSGGDYETYSVVVPIATAGGHKIAFVGTSTLAGTAFVDAVSVTATGATAGNAGFEAAGTWSFGANTGVTPNGSAFTNQNPPAPQGGQVAYILGNGAAATLSQTISGWQPGTYTLTFLAAQRANYPAGGLQTLQIKLDGVVVGELAPVGTDYRSYAATFALAGGSHTIAFVGLSTTLATAFIDDVALLPTSPASRRWTVYDGFDPILDFDGAGAQTARYLQGVAAVDEVLARETAAGVAWYLPDRLGTIRDLVDNSGAVIDHVDYNAFGRASGETAPAVGDRLMGFAGLERSRATGLNLAVHRAQDPNTGKWLSEDPIGFAAGDANLYRYVGNRSSNWMDPSGLESKWGGVAVAGAKGVAQGGLNTLNGVQDVGIGALNTPAFVWNWTAGWVAPNCPYIPSPDWSKGRITDEDPFLHDASKFLGGSGVTVLAPFIPKLFGKSCPKPTASVPQTTPTAIRTNAELVQEVATRAERWGARQDLSPTGSVPGTLKHGYADRLLTRYQQMCGPRGLTTEVRYLNGRVWRPGMPTKGSIRLDVVEGPLTGPTQVFDYKFGGALLDSSRIGQIRAGAGLGPAIRVIQVKP